MDYKIVDVFTSVPLKGNPVAVVLDGSSLTTEQMQTIAQWTNLSETTFVVPKTEETADYHVRIFDPTSEMPFAGHPTLGTAHALLEAGIVERKQKLIQQCKRGLVELELGDVLQFSIKIDSFDSFSMEETAELAAVLGRDVHIVGDPMMVDAGPHWIAVKVSGSEADLLAYKPNQTRIREYSDAHGYDGLCVYSDHSRADGDIEVRTFAPSVECNEDPVCGSGNAAVAFHRAHGKPYLSSQGSARYRDGRVHVGYQDGRISVGGSCVTVVDAKLRI